MSATALLGSVAVTALQSAGAVQELLRSAKSDSLVEYTRVSRVEPLVFVDEGLVHLDYMPNVMQSLSALFAGYYLQAIAISMNVGRVDTVKLLDKMNPNRDPVLSAAGAIGAGLQVVGNAIAKESYGFKLPVPQVSVGVESYGQGYHESLNKTYNFMNVKDGKVSYSQEAFGEQVKAYLNNEDSVEDQVGANVGGSIQHALTQRALDGNKTDSSYRMELQRGLYENVNLSVGRILEVQVQDGAAKATIPVQLRLISVPMSSDNIVRALNQTKQPTSMMERFHGWRAGELSFIKDLIFCQDLLDEHKRNLMRDTSGQYKSTLAQSNKNALASIVSGRLSIASASNMMVLSAGTASKLEAAMGGRLKDFNFREKIFKKSYQMLLVVVDTNWERVTIYTRSIEHASQHSIKELKAAGGKKDIDITEILNAYKMGSAPSI